MQAQRIGCLWIPHFPVWVLRRQRPALSHQPLIVGGTPGEARRSVVACSAEARAAGVGIGMGLREAQLRCPTAVFLPADEEAEQAIQEQLFILLERFSPRLESVRPGLLLFDAAGLERHYPSEEALAQKIIATVQEGLGVAVRIGLASTRFCARVAAAYATPVRCIAPGCEGAFLAPLPVHHLPGLAPWHWRLQFLGIRTIGDYATQLPYNDVVVRYGPEAAQAHLLARGIDPLPVQPEYHAELPTASQRFEPPEERLEPLIFALKRHLDHLCAPLARDGWLCSQLQLRCSCEGAEDVTLMLRPAEPSATAGRLRDLLRWNIEQRWREAETKGGQLFGGGITQFELQLAGLVPATGQALDLFSAERSGKRNILRVIERLEALLGPDSVRQALPTGGRRPDESFSWAPYRPEALEQRKGRRSARAAPARSALAATGGSQPLPLAVVAAVPPSLPGRPLPSPALRLFDPPRPVQVREREGMVVALSAGRGLEIAAVCAGPWRLDERWWDDEARRRDYFQVSTRSGRVYLLYRTGETWLAQGIFD